MAEVNTAGDQTIKRRGFGVQQKQRTRIDMTPMVDLGFLLITFFVYTTSLTDHKAMELNMPDEKGSPTPTKESGAFTLIPDEKGIVYYYEGDQNKAQIKKANIKDIRKIIMDKKRRTAPDDLFIIIKPTKLTSYQSVVNILDEMVISDIHRYALIKISNEEEAQILPIKMR